MKYRYKDLSKEEKTRLDNARKRSFYVSYHALKRNKVFIDKEYVREVAKKGKILSYENRGNKGEVLIIGNRKDDIIEGELATLIIVVNLAGNNVMTCYYRLRHGFIYNFCKKEV